MRQALVVLIATLGACASAPRPVALPADPPQVQALVAAAHQRGLAHSRQWLTLGHWRPTTFGGYESEADGAAFFLAPTGKTDPGAELAATLRAFFAPAPALPPPPPDAVRPPPSPHALCRFPARLAWLSTELAIDPARLPAVRCPGLERFAADLSPRGVSLVFSSYYLGAPASAFGHTFLRLHRDDARLAGERRELLDFGIDFSADVDTTNAALYAFKGLTGQFPGTFKRVPYYYKVREYNDHESRDLWDYELALSPAQLRQLLAHLWELGQTHFDYYYLDENCSYHILAALEAALPHLPLTDGFGVHVIPADTVKRLMEHPGLVRAVRYRASLRTQLVRRVAQLTDAQLDAAHALADDPRAASPALPQAELVAAMDAAADLIDLRHADELLRGEGVGADKKHALLARRAALGVTSPELDLSATELSGPHLAHGSARFGFGMGLTRAGGVVQTLDWRPAMHDLADAPRGYPELASLEFFPTRLRLTHDPAPSWDDLALASSVVRVTTLAPLRRIEHKVSWRLDAGVTTLEDLGRPGALAGQLRLAAGAALGWLDDRVVVFAGADTRVLGGPSVPGAWDGPVRLSAGPWGGLRLRLSDPLVALVTADWLLSPWQAGPDPVAVDATLRWLVTEHLGLSLEARLRGEAADAQLLALFYY